MKKKLTFTSEINSELENAHLARQSGNEGKARVCARRAAGIAVRNYFLETSKGEQIKSSFELIRIFSEQPGLPPEIKKIASNLTLRVTKSFDLPEEVDLIEDAQKLCNYLSNIKNQPF